MKYVLLSLVLFGTSLPGMVSAKSETPPDRQASSFTLEQYQADFKSIGDMVNNMDIDAFTKMDEENIQAEDLQRAIKAAKSLRSTTQQINVTTPEGRQVKQDFIALADISIKTYSDYPKWKANEALEEKYAEALELHQKNVLNSLQALKALAEY